MVESSVTMLVTLLIRMIAGNSSNALDRAMLDLSPVGFTLVLKPSHLILLEPFVIGVLRFVAVDLNFFFPFYSIYLAMAVVL